MKRLLSTVLSLFIAVMLIGSASLNSTITTAEETASANSIEDMYDFVNFADFENGETSSYISNTQNCTLSVIESAEYANGGSKVLKAVCKDVSVNSSNVSFLTLNFNEALLKDSYGFRFFVKADDSVYNELNLSYSVNVNGITEKYLTKTGASVDSLLSGSWVIVKWGDVDKSGLNWYHNGSSGWGYNVQPRDFFTTLSSLTVNVTTAATANSGAQTFYIDDFQMLYTHTTEVTTTQSDSLDEDITLTSPTPAVTNNDYKYITLENFEDMTTGTTFNSEEAIGDYLETDFNGTASIVDNTNYINGTKGLKVVNGVINYNTSDSRFLVLNLTNAELKDSLGFRFFVKGDDSLQKSLNLTYSITIDGIIEKYQTNTGVSVESVKSGAWVTVKWGDVDTAGLNWYHNGMSEWGFDVQSADVMTTLDALAIKLRISADSTLAAQTFYVDDFQMIYTADVEIVNTTDAISTINEASIRLNQVNGMRFYTSVDEALLTNLVGKQSYELGTIIAPNDVIEGEFTHEDLNIDVNYNAKSLWAGNEYVSSIVSIKSANYAREFVARGYVKVGTTYYYSKTTCTRTVSDIADAYISDENSGYTSLSNVVKELVASWAKAND